MPIHDWTRVTAGIFHDCHHAWIEELKRALNRDLLPPEYYALAEQIVAGRGPDVLTLERIGPPSSGGVGHAPAATATRSSGVVLADPPPRARFTAVAEPELYARKRTRVVIRHSSDDRVIAVIELVSPGNKSSRHEFRTFVEKAIELLDAAIHLMVVDLFPPGTRDPQGIHAAIWSEVSDDEFRLPPDKRLTLVSYNASEVKTAYIEPVAVSDALPDMPLFLTPGSYVPVPLESTYAAAFDAVPRRWRDVLAANSPG